MTGKSADPLVDGEASYEFINLNFVERDWALDQPLEDLAKFQKKIWTVAGLPFLSDGAYFSTNKATHPYLGLNIAMGGVARLHMLHWGSADTVEYRIHYDDGDMQSAVCSQGEAFRWAAWYVVNKMPICSPEGASVFSWSNPYPEKVIDWLNIYVRDGNCQLIAVTAEGTDRIVKTPPADTESRFQAFRSELREQRDIGKVLAWESLKPQDYPRLMFSRAHTPMIKARIKQRALTEVYNYYSSVEDGETDPYGNLIYYLVTGDRKYILQAKQWLLENSASAMRSLEAGQSPQTPARTLTAVPYVPY